MSEKTREKRRKPPAVQAYEIQDGDGRYFVRGTHDPEVALEAIIDEYPEAGEDLDVESEDVDYRMVAVLNENGWFRFNPCNCGEGHAWDLWPVSGPGRGRFIGVMADVVLEEEVFEVDLDVE